MLLQSYNPDWPRQFDQEAEKIQEALGSNCTAIHHIGSTSVPGLAAKPIIDILPVVKNIELVTTLTDYNSRGENGIPFRRFFQKPGYHVHIYEVGSPEISRHLKFRDWMRTHEEDAQAYADLKKQLAQKFPDDRLSYSLAKEDFITAIDAKDGYRGDRMAIALTNREQRALHHLRAQYFPTLQSTLNLDEYLMFYHNTDIIGCAQIHFQPAILRFFIIDEDSRYLGLGRTFLQLVEKWVKSRGEKVLYLHATCESAPFYTKMGYTPIPFEEGKEGEIEMGKDILNL